MITRRMRQRPAAIAESKDATCECEHGDALEVPGAALPLLYIDSGGAPGRFAVPAAAHVCAACGASGRGVADLCGYPEITLGAEARAGLWAGGEELSSSRTLQVSGLRRALQLPAAGDREQGGGPLGPLVVHLTLTEPGRPTSAVLVSCRRDSMGVLAGDVPAAAPQIRSEPAVQLMDKQTLTSLSHATRLDSAALRELAVEVAAAAPAHEAWLLQLSSAAGAEADNLLVVADRLHDARRQTPRYTTGRYNLAHSKPLQLVRMHRGQWGVVVRGSALCGTASMHSVLRRMYLRVGVAADHSRSDLALACRAGAPRLSLESILAKTGVKVDRHASCALPYILRSQEMQHLVTLVTARKAGGDAVATLERLQRWLMCLSERTDSLQVPVPAVAGQALQLQLPRSNKLTKADANVLAFSTNLNIELESRKAWQALLGKLGIREQTRFYNRDMLPELLLATSVLLNGVGAPAELSRVATDAVGKAGSTRDADYYRRGAASACWVLTRVCGIELGALIPALPDPPRDALPVYTAMWTAWHVLLLPLLCWAQDSINLPLGETRLPASPVLDAVRAACDAPTGALHSALRSMDPAAGALARRRLQAPLDAFVSDRLLHGLSNGNRTLAGANTAQTCRALLRVLAVVQHVAANRGWNGVSAGRVQRRDLDALWQKVSSRLTAAAISAGAAQAHEGTMNAGRKLRRVNQRMTDPKTGNLWPSTLWVDLWDAQLESLRMMGAGAPPLSRGAADAASMVFHASMLTALHGARTNEVF